jgi:hypothetical protein
LRSVRFAEETPLHELPAELEIAGDGMLGGLVIYFRAQLHGGVELSNAPFAPATSWTRVVRDLPRRRAVRQGERIPLRSRIEAIDGRQRILIDL